MNFNKNTKYSNVPGSKLKWHDVVVLKNVFRYCVKHVAIQRCHIGRWHQAIRESRDAVQDNFRTGRPHGEEHS